MLIHGYVSKGEFVMTPEQMQIVQKSWAMVMPIAPQAAELFYERLFELDPSLRALFKSDMTAQGEKLTRAITSIVCNLDKLDSLLPGLRALGKRHIGYGAEPAHYDTVGAALLWTLEQGLGADFTPAVRAAWAEAYNILATVMKDAAALSEAA